MAVTIVGVAGATDRELPADWDCPYNAALVHQVVKACEAREHAGTHKQKTRAEVSGGGRKPWQQKKLGRARAGSLRSPLWRKGGVTFAADGQRAPTPKVNRRMYRAAMRAVLVQMARLQRVQIADDMRVPSARTKEGVTLLKALDCDQHRGRLMLVLDATDPQLQRALHNIPRVQVLTPHELTPRKLLGTQRLLCSTPALDIMTEWLA